ncbi:flippase [Rhodococcus sp. IEGM 1379]|nr:flippase [Rhodococcus sp. IEGM 1379]
MTDRRSSDTDHVSPRKFAELKRAAQLKFEKERRERETMIHQPSTPELTANAARRSTAIMLGSRVAVAAMGWTGSVLIARAISPEQFGQFSLIFGLLGLLSVITDLGVGRVVLAKLVESNPWEISLVTTAFISLRIALGLLGYLLALGYVWILGYPAEVVEATAIAGLVVVVATPSHALSVMYQSRLKMTYVAVAEGAGQLAQLMATIAAVLWQPLLIILVIPAVINEMVAAVIKIRGVRKGIAGPLPASRAQFRRWREMLIEAIPLSIGFAFITLLSKIDVLMLGKLDTFDSVGLYSIGYKFADLLQIVAITVVTPVTTLLVSSWPDKLDIFRERSREAFIVLAVLGSASIAAFWPAATEVLSLLYGERFTVAETSTRLLVLGACFSMLTQLGLMVLIASGRHRTYPWVALAGLGFNIVANLVLIPRFSFNGAAIATVVTEMLLFVAIWIVVVRTVPAYNLFPAIPVVATTAIGALVTTVGTICVERFSIPWLLVSIAAPAVIAAIFVVVPISNGKTLLALIKPGGDNT